jgi:plastocyanin domain-containing protein
MRFHTLVAATALAFLASCAPKPADQAAAPADGPIHLQVVPDGFEPNVITVRQGQPVTLIVTRTTDKTCATEFVLKDHNINQPLPLNQPVTITFTPDKPGDLQYSCAMDMFRGTIRVQ